jgi:hypothetical protein
MVSVAGSIIMTQDNSDLVDDKSQKTPGLLTNLLGFVRQMGKQTEEEASMPRGSELLIWSEFPWERYLLKEDIISKWRSVDMKHINKLHRHFDAEQGKFVNIPLEQVSMVHTYSQVEGLTNE